MFVSVFLCDFVMLVYIFSTVCKLANMLFYLVQTCWKQNIV